MFVGVFVGVNVGVKSDKKWAFPGLFTLAGSGYTRFAHGACRLRPKGSLSLTQKLIVPNSVTLAPSPFGGIRFFQIPL